MPENPKEEIRVECPDIHCYQYDKENNIIYMQFYDKIMDQEYMFMFEAFNFIEWFGSRELAEVKSNTIKLIEKL